MPRTKVIKNSKRNREAAVREEQIRNFEVKMETFATNIDELCHVFSTQVDTKLKMIISSMNTQLLQMKMGDFLELKLGKMCDFKAGDQTIQGLDSHSICNTTSSVSTKEHNRNDEGYLTEDSTIGGSGLNSASAMAAFTSNSTTMMHPLRSSSRALRTPGPLHSARARRGRRSRSACGELNVPSSAKAKNTIPIATVSCSSSMADHSSRSKMRTPAASRVKAFSADRTPCKLLLGVGQNSSPSTPPVAFLRWPKPGEVALSKCGSPMVSQVMPDHIPNVNIPIRNGVLSLRPKKLAELNADFFDAIDPETLHHIKTLHENLNMIVNMADKATLK